MPVCSLAIPEGTVGKGALQARRQIVQRPKPIGSALGGCLISWCIIPGCLLCQFATEATLSSQLRGLFWGHRIAKGTLKGFQITATTVILTVPTTTHHSFNMIQNDINSSTAATKVAPKPVSISFCNIRGLSSKINPVHHHLQSINPYALFLTETKIKPLDPSNSTVLLSPHLKCPGYELSSSFFPNCGVIYSLCCADLTPQTIRSF